VKKLRVFCSSVKSLHVVDTLVPARLLSVGPEALHSSFDDD